MNVQEITVVEEKTVGAFTAATNRLFEHGWKLSGGMSVIVMPGQGTTFYQALVREYEQPGAWG